MVEFAIRWLEAVTALQGGQELFASNVSTVYTVKLSFNLENTGREVEFSLSEFQPKLICLMKED